MDFICNHHDKRETFLFRGKMSYLGTRTKLDKHCEKNIQLKLTPNYKNHTT